MNVHCQGSCLVMIAHDGSQCRDGYSCSFGSITVNTTTDIECYGHFSCTQSNISSISSSTTSFIECHGSFSCYKSPHLLYNGLNIGNAIICGGLYSCADITNLTNVYSLLGCNGEYSCFNSTIYLPGTAITANLDCDGTYSCANSIICTKKM